MEAAIRDSLRETGAKVRYGEPLKAHTSLGIGGAAEIFAEPSDAGQLEGLLRLSAGMPVYIMGGGTNLLVADGPLEMLVISTSGLRGIEKIDEDGGGVVLGVWAGEPLKGLLSFCQRNGFSGLEGLAGIPGSVGGAVKGNAGAHGTEMKDIVEKVAVARRDGTLEARSAEAMGFKYRGSGLSESEMVLRAEIRLKKDGPEEIRKRMNEHFGMKKKSQPLSARSAGCVFKNPEGFPPAGKLIDEAGLKGASRGGIEVSGIHANFFVNRGNGTASDFFALMDMVAAEVRKRSGAVLDPEIRILK
ncbi:MAG: UDP-N-acetylmuramate dehydrogenase [Nitrospiraceae bacterium]|nr:UDP-N-acetylmuramate dehydrogenase [Nitrospiraceae bacterium]